MTDSNIPKALQLKNKFISFPYINSKANDDPVYRLLVDIEQEEKTNSFSVSLKYAYCEFYPKYEQYLNENTFGPSDDEIYNYYNTIIKAPIAYKYNLGQFGYISLSNTDSLESSFVRIENLCKHDTEIFFLHDELQKYKIHHYDITSSTAKELTDEQLNKPSTAWITESIFVPIDGTIDDAKGAKTEFIELLNWKICREDYLLKTVMRMRMKLESNADSQMILNRRNGIRFAAIEKAGDITANDIDSSYSGITDTDEKSSYYTSTDNELNISTDLQNISSSARGSNKSGISDYDQYDEKLPVIEEYGYIKDKDLEYTLKGELFIAVNMNKDKNEEPVAIKKISWKRSNIGIVIDENLVREALILRGLKTRNAFIRDSIVKYTDFFRSQTECYFVMELNFSVNLKHFVIKSHEYLNNGKLQLMEYKEIIRYLLWRLTATIHWLHNDMNCCDLDICPENIMLSRADFIQNSRNNSIAINGQIEMKMVDFSMREMLDICHYDKLKQFKSTFNTKYIASNQQYLTFNNNNPHNEYNSDSRCHDMWRFGMVIYYCFMGHYPYNMIPETEEELYGGHWAVQNGKLRQYLGMRNNLKLINPNILSLINGLLNIDDRKRLNAGKVLKHKWFNSFYKTYLSFCDQ